MQPNLELHIFDMDGTLVDTKAATLQAYRYSAHQLGLDIFDAMTYEQMEIVIWGKTAKQWNCPPELHKRKVDNFLQLASSGEIKEAWAAETYKQLWIEFCKNLSTHQLRIWTGASGATVDALRTCPVLRSLLSPEVHCGMSVDEKHKAMRGLRAIYADRTIHYYDNDDAAGYAVLERIKNCVLHLPNRREMFQ